MIARDLTIGEAAEASGLSTKTIRYYERIGLIPKASRRNSQARTGGDRIYGEADLGCLQFIRHARLLGLGLADIRELVALADGKGAPSRHPAYRRVLAKRLKEIDERVGHLLGLRAAIEHLVAPERSPEGETCASTTCCCMQPEAVPILEPDPARRTSTGGTDV